MTTVRPKTRALIFGVFDLLHKGHHSLFKQALKHAKELVVVVARGKMVERIKGIRPSEGERVRVQNVKKIPGVYRAVLGDKKMGAYTALHKFKPDVICCGYDQRALYADLKERMKAGEIPRAKIVRLKPHHPHRFKSSIERIKRG